MTRPVPGPALDLDAIEWRLAAPRLVSPVLDVIVRQDVPALVAEVKQLREALQAVRERLGRSDWIVSAELLSALDAALDGAE